MKKISRKDLQGLRQQFPVLTKEMMQHYVGGLTDSYLDPNWLFSDPDFTDFGINLRSSSGYGGGSGTYGGNPYGYTDGNLNLPPMDDYYPVNGGMLDEVTIYGNKPDSPNIPNKPDIPYSYPEIPDKLDPINPKPKPDDDYPGPSYYYDDWPKDDPIGCGYGWGGYPEWNWPYIGGYYGYGNYGHTSGGGGGGSLEGGNEDYKYYSEKWEKDKILIYQIANEIGVNLTNVKITFATGRGANAWRGEHEIFIGIQFYENLTNNNDRAAVLIHELYHLESDDPNTVVKKESQSGFLATQATVPDFVKKYIDITIERTGGVTAFGYDFDFNTYLDYSELSSPVYYENELKAYKKELETCPDSFISEEYALERKYKIWRYEKLLETAKNNKNLNN